MKDREQNLGIARKFAHVVGAIGLLATSCAPSINPPIEVSKKLERGNVSIEKISDHSYFVWPVGKWSWDKDSSREAGVRHIAETCTIERTLEYTGQDFYKVVITSQPNCVPELK